MDLASVEENGGPLGEGNARESTPLVMSTRSEPSVPRSALLSQRSATTSAAGRTVSFNEEESSVRTSRSNKTGFFNRYLRLKWTDSLRNRTAVHHAGVYPAAYLLRDAITGAAADMTEAVLSGYDFFDPYSDENHPLLNRIARACRWLLTLRFSYYIERTAVWVLVFLTAVEPPFWCRDYDPVDVKVANGFGECHTLLSMRGPPAFGDEDEVDYYPNTHTNLLSADQSMAVEWSCIAIIVALLAARFGAEGMSLSRSFLWHRRRIGDQKELKDESVNSVNRGARMIRIVKVCSVITLIGGMVWSSCRGTDRPVPLLNRVIVAFTYSRGSQREFASVTRLAPELASILFLLLVIIVFYAWIGVVMFYETQQGAESFSNLIEAMWTLWICVTTANYPDVMMPAYNESRITAIYFVSFMVITFFFMMNVILASVVNSYNNEDDERKERIKSIRKNNLRQAFKLLDNEGEGYVDREAIMGIFLVLNEDCPEIRHIPEDIAELLFAVLDRDGSNQISEEEFMSFAKVMLLEFEEASVYYTFIERNFPDTFNSRRYQAFCKAVKSDTFEWVVDAVVLLNAVVVAIQSYPELAGEQRVEDPHIADGYIDTIWEGFQTVFTVIYCIEMLTKILVLGWKRYSESYRNLFDAFITVLAFASTCYVYYPNRFSDSRLIRFVVMARVLRLIRVLVAMPQFQVIGGTFIDILPAARRIVVFLFFIMYVFSAIGMDIFGGMISRDPSNHLSERLRGTDFAVNAYWANNFNDLLSGMNVLFNLLVVNNWTEMADGILAVSDSKLSRYFFLAFHISGVIVVCNLVIAFIIDSFLDEWNEAAGITDQVDTGDAVITTDKRAHFDATEITGTKTNLSGEYVAKMKKTDLMLSMRMGEELRNLFTKSDSEMDSLDCSER